LVAVWLSVTKYRPEILSALSDTVAANGTPAAGGSVTTPGVPAAKAARARRVASEVLGHPGSSSIATRIRRGCHV
jgi:hypothetical protein